MTETSEIEYETTPVYQPPHSHKQMFNCCFCGSNELTYRDSRVRLNGNPLVWCVWNDDCIAQASNVYQSLPQEQEETPTC